MIALFSTILWAGLAFWINAIHPPPSQELNSYINKLKNQRNMLVVLIFTLPIPMFLFFNLFIGAGSIEQLITSAQHFAVPSLFIVILYVLTVFDAYKRGNMTLAAFGFVEDKQEHTMLFIQRITNILSQKAGIEPPDVRFIKSRSNMPDITAAAFYPLGSKKCKILLSTNFVNQLSLQELYATLGHEIGHVKNNDMIITNQLSFLYNVIVMIIPVFFWFVYTLLFVMSSPAFPFLAVGLVAMSAYLTHRVFKILFQFMYLKISRKKEYMADAYSVKLVGKEAMISLMDSFNKKDQEFLEILSKVDYDAFQLEKKRGDISRTHPLTERRLNTIKEMDYPDRVEDVHIPHR